MSDTDGIERRFNHHPPATAQDSEQHARIRATLRTLAHHLDGELPDGREKSLVMTKLEEAMFWANAALARKRAEQ